MVAVKSFAGNAKITEESVRALRRLSTTHTPKELAKIYRIGLETVRRILRRDTWAWVEDIMPAGLGEMDTPVEPLTPAEQQAADASLARVLAATGMGKLAAETAKHFRADGMVEELIKDAQARVNPLDE